ncbi:MULTISPECIES: ATP-binding protein [unclassified Vibrio]|uniref:sensor histidine kinase n=1 Tax=unclassified Vibrio TaxID=2614977 RepID=UPI002555E340|nr:MULTISPECIES: ATP-binding protein [unclassified Vibrio]
MANKITRFLTPSVIASLLLGAAGLAATHLLAEQYQQRLVREQLEEAANKANLQLDSELAKFKQVPAILSHDPRILGYFSKQTTAQQLNLLLEDWASQSLADTIYIHDDSGTVVASSNYQDPKTFVGENFAFRPYFSQAINGDKSQYVGLGARSNVRGYFLSSPLYVAEEIVGVLTVKVSLENIEAILTSDGFDIVVLDNNQVVFLSSQPQWLYHSLQPLSLIQQQQIAQQRQYGLDQITLIDDFLALSQPVSELPSKQLSQMGRFNVYPATTSSQQYQVVALKGRETELKKVTQIDAIFLVIYSLVLLIAWSWRQTYKAKVALTTLNHKLEETVNKRTLYLQQSNQQLQQTIHQYQESQSKLKQTEQELTQTAKLAVLGELSASINHEINQPLAALRTYSENSLKLLEMGRTDMVKGNLDKMLALNMSITDIIARLKVFTRKVTKQENHTANLHQAVNNATGILSALLIKQGITLRMTSISDDIQISIHPTELEQVLVNLIHNAAQALNQQPSPQIGLEWRLESQTCVLDIWDNGVGLPESKLSQLFDPFFTTKPEGLGLGLSISKRIIEAYHGSITATRREPCGMVFSLRIPLQTVTSDTSPEHTADENNQNTD